jgi:hypothetical protein
LFTVEENSIQKSTDKLTIGSAQTQQAILFGRL